MPKISSPLSSSRAQAIEESLLEYFAKLGEKSPQSFQIEEGSGGLYIAWLISGVKYSDFNAVCLSKIPRDEADQIIDRVLEPFKFSKVPMEWWITPSSSPPDLRDRLEKRGLKLREEMWGMSADLSKLPETTELPSGLQVKRIENAYQMIEWVDCSGAAFGVPADQLSETLKLFDHGYDEEGDFVHYRGLLDGKIVATSSILYGDDNAGLYDVATLPHARGKGIGRAMTLAPLLDARERGYKVGVLQASKMGYKIYESLGFKEECKMAVMSIDYSQAPPSS